MRSSITLLLAALLVVGFAVPVAAAGTVYVPLPTGDPVTDWNNIQSAVDSADDGDTVQFGAGTYVLGDESEFVVVSGPEVRLVGSPQGTTVLGGEVPPVPESEPGFPHLYGDNSLLQSPPQGFYLTADEQRIADIRFEGFRTAVMVGFGDFAPTGGYVVEDCEFERTMYGIVAHVESDEESAIRNNDFINTTFPYDLSGGRFRVSDNYLASPDPERIPIDYTHHAGALSAGGFFEEGQARISEHNVFERNIVDGGVTDGYAIFSDPGGVVRNNLFRDSEFSHMTFAGTFTVGFGFGGDIVDNVFVNNTLQGSGGTGFLLWNFGGGLIDGNLVVGNEMTSVAGDFYYPGGVAVIGATNTVFMDNTITGVAPDPVSPGAGIYFGHSNQFLLNNTDGDPAAWFYNSPDGLFASDNPADVAVDENGDPVDSLDPYQDFTRLLSCQEHLKDTESVEDFRECVNDALEELH
jgi:hypothetical protein